MTTKVKRVQIVGTSKAALATFVGRRRELLLDTDDWTISVHNGTKPGGRRMLPEDGDASATTARAAGATTARPLSERFAETVNLLDFRSYVSDGDWQGAFAAAVAQMPAAGAALELPQGEIVSGAKVTVTGKDFFLRGKGLGVSRVTFSGATGGFEFIDNATSANAAKLFVARDVSILTDRTGMTALRAKWRPCAYFFRRYCDIQSVDIRTVNINAGQAWAKGVHLTNVHGSSVRSVSFSNQRDVVTGDGILFDGFSLANTVQDHRVLYTDRAIAIDPMPVVILSYGSQTANLTPGSVVTSSGGATGVLLFIVADYGATGTLAVAPISGTWTIGHTLSDGAGGNGAITAIDLTRTRGSEGLYVWGGEAVGVNYGLHADCMASTAKKITGIKLFGSHANAYKDAVHIAYASQATVKDCLLYASANNTAGVRIVGVDDADVIGNQIRPSAAGLTGTVGIVTAPATGGNVPNECTRATVQGNSVDSLVTGIAIGAGSFFADVRFNRIVNCTTDITSATAAFPGTANGALIQDNRLSGALDNQIIGPTTTAARSDGGLVRVALQNATRTWAMSNYGSVYTPNGAMVFSDETAGANRLVLGTDGVVDVVSGAARISQTGNAISRLTMQNSQRTWALSVYASAQSPAGGFALSDETAGRIALAADTSGTISVNGTSVINVRGLTLTRPYTLSTLPSAAANTYAIARATDGTKGKVVESDGSNWNYMDGSLARAG